VHFVTSELIYLIITQRARLQGFSVVPHAANHTCNWWSNVCKFSLSNVQQLSGKIVPQLQQLQQENEQQKNRGPARARFRYSDQLTFDKILQDADTLQDKLPDNAKYTIDYQHDITSFCTHGSQIITFNDTKQVLQFVDLDTGVTLATCNVVKQKRKEDHLDVAARFYMSCHSESIDPMYGKPSSYTLTAQEEAFAQAAQATSTCIVNPTSKQVQKVCKLFINTFGALFMIYNTRGNLNEFFCRKLKVTTAPNFVIADVGHTLSESEQSLFLPCGLNGFSINSIVKVPLNAKELQVADDCNVNNKVEVYDKITSQVTMELESAMVAQSKWCADSNFMSTIGGRFATHKQLCKFHMSHMNVKSSGAKTVAAKKSVLPVNFYKFASSDYVKFPSDCNVLYFSNEYASFMFVYSQFNIGEFEMVMYELVTPKKSLQDMLYGALTHHRKKCFVDVQISFAK